jgi:hypothetical protein
MVLLTYMKNTSKKRKITLWVPTELLEAALESGNGNITSVVQKGLALIAASSAYTKLSKMRGKVRVNLDLNDLRKDR